MEHGDLIRSQNLTDDLLERRADVRRQTEQRVMLLEPLGGEHALRGVTRIRLVSELLRGDGQVDLRDLELRHIVDETERCDPQLLRLPVTKRVVIVGGGMSGLTAAIYLARAGCSVTIFERRRILGGRAITHLRHGYRFNLGPHAVYRNGASSIVYRELGIPVRGGQPPAKGIAIHGGSRYSLPVGAF